MEIVSLLLEAFPLQSMAFMFVFGTVMGSFVHCMGYRVAAGMSLRYPPSQCGACKRTLKPVDLIPVFSYLIFRGRCRKCGVQFSALYVGIEILAGAGFPVLWLLFQDIALTCLAVAFWWLVLGVFSYLLHKKTAIHQE